MGGLTLTTSPAMTNAHTTAHADPADAAARALLRRMFDAAIT
jgi:hypothetical protein